MIRKTKSDNIEIDGIKVLSINLSSTRLKSAYDGRVVSPKGHHYIQFNVHDFNKVWPYLHVE